MQITRVILLFVAAVSPSNQQGCPMDINFIVDHSGSIQDTSPGDVRSNLNWVYIRQFLVGLVSNFTISGSAQTQVSCVTYGDNTSVIFNLNQYSTQSQIIPVLANLDFMNGGTANVTGALRTVRTSSLLPVNGRRANVPAVCILVVGFPPAVERDRPSLGLTPFSDEVALDKQACTIIVMGAGKEIGATYVPVASDPLDYFEASNFSSLTPFIGAILSRLSVICPTTTAPPTTTTLPTTTTTTIPTTTTTTTVPSTTTTLPTTTTTTTTTTAPTTATTPTTTAPLNDVVKCVTSADVVFVLDASGSIGSDNFGQIKSFVANLVTTIDIDTGLIRVGLLTYSDNYQVQFNLQDLKTRRAVQTAVQQVNYTRGTTNTASALQYVGANMFSAGNGGRANARDIVVLITDGGSNNESASEAQAAVLKAAGVHIIVIGTGNWLNVGEIDLTASYPYEVNAIIVTNYTSLPSITNRLTDMICDNAQECNSNPCQNSGICVEDILFYSCQNCPTGFAGTNCDEQCRVGADVIFAVAASSGVSPGQYQQQLDFVRQVIVRLNIGSSGDSRVGMLQYGNQATTVFNLNSFNNQLDILNAISSAPTGGTTNIASAITLARNQMFTAPLGDRSASPNILVLITNGRSANITLTATEAMAARNAGITIIVVPVGGNMYVSQVETEAISSYPVNSNIFPVSNFTILITIASNVSQSLCNNVNECTTNPCLNGGTCTDLINGYSCSCPATNTGNNCQRTGSGELDIIFILDTSGSIRNERFTAILNFITSLVYGMEISATKTRVGLAQFSDSSSPVFQLNTYTNSRDIIWATKNVVFTGGRTNTASVLTLLTNNMFQPTQGDRSNAQNIAIIFTDGNSNINQTNTIPAAIALRSAGTHIIVLPIGTLVNFYEVYGIASEPVNETVFWIQSYMNLSNANLLDAVSNAPISNVNICGTNPCQSGGACLPYVKRFVCHCTSVSAGPTCAGSCSKMIDLAVILDVSGSGNFAEVWNVNVAFVRQMVLNLPTSSSGVRVSVITFGDGANVSFYLNTYNNADDIRNALSFRLSIGQGSLDVALQYLTSTVFGSALGSRPGSSKIAVIVTDSDSPGDYSAPLQQAQSAKSAGIEIYAVTIGTGPNVSEYQQIVSNSTSTHLITINGTGDVPAAVQNLVTTMCTA